MEGSAPRGPRLGRAHDENQAFAGFSCASGRSTVSANRTDDRSEVRNGDRGAIRRDAQLFVTIIDSPPPSIVIRVGSYPRKARPMPEGRGGHGRGNTARLQVSGWRRFGARELSSEFPRGI